MKGIKKPTKGIPQKTIGIFFKRKQKQSDDTKELVSFVSFTAENRRESLYLHAGSFSQQKSQIKGQFSLRGLVERRHKEGAEINFNG